MLFASFLFCIGVFTLSFLILSSIIIWKIEDDIYIYLYNHSYNFLWVLIIAHIIFSSLFSVLFLYKRTRNFIETIFVQLEDNIYFIILPFSAIISLIWLGMSCNVTQITTECFNLKKDMENEMYYDKFTCTGEILTTVFGFCMFIIWGSLLLYNTIECLKILKTNYDYNQTTRHQNNLEQQIQSPTELSEVQTRNSSLSRK